MWGLGKGKEQKGKEKGEEREKEERRKGRERVRKEEGMKKKRRGDRRGEIKSFVALSLYHYKLIKTQISLFIIFYISLKVFKSKLYIGYAIHFLPFSYSDDIRC